MFAMYVTVCHVLSLFQNSVGRKQTSYGIVKNLTALAQAFKIFSRPVWHSLKLYCTF